MNRLARFAGKILPGGREQARRPGKGWAEDVDLTNGNNNYLMFSSVDYAHSDVRADVLSWCKWMLNENGVGGFRLDAAQHISRSFLRELIHIAVNTHRQEHFGRDPFFVGEVWQGEVSKQIDWLDAVTPSPDILIRVYDTPLVNNFARISSDVSSRNPSADLRTILCNPSNPAHAALVGIRPAQAVTLVANHDTQAGQCMETHITPDMKALFYAFILLRQEGTPCVFWGDLFGTQGPRGEGPSCQVPVEGDGEKGQTRSTLPTLCLARSLFAYGEQRDYFDAADCIGWTRSGTWDRPGCVVLLSIGIDGTLARKRMWVNRGHGQRCVDLVCGRRVEVGGDGWATFEVSCRGVGVWVREGEKGAERFPVEMEGTGRR
jgi:alpha-amylase